jgi:hypothetical protein
VKKLLVFGLIISCFASKAQQLDSIYVNLYTDSLKKGTYNYINVDGLFSNGKYLPLDTTHLVFTSDEGQFIGNSLWIDPATKKEKVKIKVDCKNKKIAGREFTVYIKKKMDDEKLLTSDEILRKYEQEARANAKKKR